MAMDMLRSHNITRSRMVDGSGRIFWVRWYPCAAGAKAFPYLHAFGHPVWEDDRDDFDGVGCQFTGLEWRPKRYPAPPGQTFRGEPDWFLHGLPPDQLGAPETGDRCGTPALIPTGGVLLGGEAWPHLEEARADASGDPYTGTSFPPRIVAYLIAGGIPITATSLPRRQRSEVCVCGLPDSVIRQQVRVVSEVCGCGLPATGSAESPTIDSVVCGCGLPATGSAESPTIDSVVCGCGLPDSAHNTPTVVVSDLVAGGVPASTHTTGVTEVSDLVAGGVPASTHSTSVTEVSDVTAGGVPASTHSTSVTEVSDVTAGGVPASTHSTSVTEVSDVTAGGVPASTHSTSGPTVTVSCGSCTTMPKQYTLTVSGLTGTCAGWNGALTLTWSSSCLWSSGVTLRTWKFNAISTPTLIAFSGGTPVMTYTLTGSLSCLGPNTFALTSAGTCASSSPPATLTLNPV